MSQKRFCIDFLQHNLHHKEREQDGLSSKYEILLRGDYPKKEILRILVASELKHAITERSERVLAESLRRRSSNSISSR